MKQLFNTGTIHSFSLLLLYFMFSVVTHAQTDSIPERVYIKIEIEGMACPYCAFGMEKELKKVAGVEDVEIEFKRGLAYISTPIDQKPTKKSLEEIITNGGFTVKRIVFSDTPFKIKQTKE